MTLNSFFFSVDTFKTLSLAASSVTIVENSLLENSELFQYKS